MRKPNAIALVVLLAGFLVQGQAPAGETPVRIGQPTIFWHNGEWHTYKDGVWTPYCSAAADAPKTTGQTATGIGQRNVTIGQTTIGIGQPNGQVGQTTVAIGQNQGQIGQTTVAIGQRNGQIGQPATGIGQRNGQIGQTTIGIGQPGGQIGQTNSGMGQRNGIGQTTIGIGQPTGIAPAPSFKEAERHPRRHPGR